VRLNRYLAACGLGSRRSCEALITAGKVAVNGHFVRDLATTVSEEDEVRVAGKALRPPRAPSVVALYKPRGVLSTRSDERGRPTIYGLVPPHMGRLFHVGRLDKDSEGLMLLTDDGILGQALSHPSRKVPKEYEVTLDAPPEPAAIEKLLRGFVIEGGRARMESVHPVAGPVVRVVLSQGLKRQIRLMFYRVGREVLRLVRTRIGPVTIGSLHPGQWRLLSKHEMAALRDANTIKP
jgi:23S rRNA pseudouridine2605 synthase